MTHCEYMLYPRLLAIAENGWSHRKTNYADFHRRALHLQDVLANRGYHPFDLRKEIGERAEKKTVLHHLAVGKKSGVSCTLCVKLSCFWRCYFG